MEIYVVRFLRYAASDDVHRPDVRLDRLRRWHLNGLLCIGDAARAMSPMGGVGINLAIQDAGAAAALPDPALPRGAVPERALAAVRRPVLLFLAQHGPAPAVWFRGSSSSVHGPNMLCRSPVDAQLRVQPA